MAKGCFFVLNVVCTRCEQFCEPYDIYPNGLNDNQWDDLKREKKNMKNTRKLFVQSLINAEKKNLLEL